MSCQRRGDHGLLQQRFLLNESHLSLWVDARGKLLSEDVLGRIPAFSGGKKKMHCVVFLNEVEKC